MSIPKNEQETSVSYGRDDEKMSIYTSDSTVMTKLDKRVKEYPDTWVCVKEIHDMYGDLVAKIYEAPKEMLSFRSEKSKRTGNPNGGEALRKWREEQKRLKETKE